MSLPLVIELTILVLAAFLGFEVISKVPTMLHTPLMSGTNFIHGIVDGRFVRPTIVTPSRSTISPGTVSSQLPPVSAARSTITDPGRIRATAPAGISRGAARPGTSAVVIATS